jgi:ribosomal protein S27AE
MSQVQNFDLSKPPVGQRRCPKCGLPMFLSQIELTETLHEDQRKFECVQCAYAETDVASAFLD